MCLHALVCLFVNPVQTESKACVLRLALLLSLMFVHFAQVVACGCRPLILFAVWSIPLCEWTTRYISIQLLMGGWAAPSSGLL